MDSRNRNGNARRRELDQEIDQYRDAAIAALGQLEWIVAYLHKIRRPELARALERNRRQILEEARLT
jgi:hypothetical protein